ncbi:uncharacterized protein LOC113681966 isoform X2 [Pocillopora damicornis]|uniref:uncharacterized protein LOC113681966 isoform X2 n=1 Tax=Pocillopora damicornis TaxID=46731 RepID=UPI000F54C68E|nr:uncharacterized protein LOC113681966 isoform X2 [Pocillopora damicornis]
MLSPSKVSKDASCRSPRRPRKRLLSYEIQSDESQTKQQWSDGEKKRLQGFLNEMLRVGCLKGFKYFALYLRGREELICRVLNEPMSPEIWSYYTSPSSEKTRKGTLSFTFDDQASLPRNDLSGYGFMDIGLPPASPSEKDIDLKDDKSTLFLIAAYARYSCPYVWVRSNHERLVALSNDSGKEKLKDSPLKLKSTAEWKQRDSKLWDIIAEIVKLCMYPAPLNPFAIDFKYFEGLPLVQRVIATGAMAHFLQKVVASGDHAYNARVFDDLGEITRRHFKDLQTLVRQRRLQEIEQASPQNPVQYNTQPQDTQYYNTRQQKQQTNYYQTGPVQQSLQASGYSGQYQSGKMY